MRTQFTTLALASALLACQAGAQVLPDDTTPEVPPTSPAEPTAHEQVLQQLSGYHGLPSEQALLGIPGAEAVLWAILDDPTALGVHRERALLSLRYFPSPALRARLEQMLGAATGANMLEHDAIVLFGELYRDEAAIAVLAPLVAAPDEQLGLSAVEALGRMQVPAADAVLREAASQTLAPLVLEAITNVLSPR